MKSFLKFVQQIFKHLQPIHHKHRETRRNEYIARVAPNGTASMRKTSGALVWGLKHTMYEKGKLHSLIPSRRYAALRLSVLPTTRAVRRSKKPKAKDATTSVVCGLGFSPDCAVMLMREPRRLSISRTLFGCFNANLRRSTEPTGSDSKLMGP